MLAGGSDAAIIPSGIGGFIACKALSRRNEEPERASRPWDKGRDGFVMGEGAGAPRGCLLPRSACWVASAWRCKRPVRSHADRSACAFVTWSLIIRLLDQSDRCS